MSPRTGAIVGAALRRELLLAWRRPGEALSPLAFFVLVCALFPLGAGADPALLRSIAPGVVWIAALLAGMLGTGRLYAADHASGALEQWLVTPAPLGLLVAARIGAHWLLGALPLIAVTPLVALGFRLEWPEIAILLTALLLGTPVLYLLGSVMAALTLGARGGGALVGLLLLPLLVPVLVFGSGAVYAVQRGLPAAPHLALLGALLVLAVVFAPWAGAAALRIALE